MSETESRYLVGETWEFYEAYLDSRKTARIQYIRYFLKFLEWISMDTDQLYQKVRDDLNSDEPMRRMWLGKKILEFEEYMRDELGYRTESGMATRTVKFPHHAVVAFFKSLGIKNIPMESHVEIESEEIPIIYAPQLREMVEATGYIRDKAMICFLKDSGLRAGDVGKVTTKMIRKANHLRGYGVDPLESEEVDFCTFTIIPEKTRKLKMKADPVIGPETLKWLRKWNEWKKKNGLPTDDSTPLFCTIESKKGHFKEGTFRPPTERGKPLNNWNIAQIFHHILKKVGLDQDEEGNPTKISPHSCRKFNQTMLEHAKVPTNWINKMTGRKGIGTSGIYSKPDPAQLIEHYSGAYNKLCIFEYGLTEDFQRKQLLRQAALLLSPEKLEMLKNIMTGTKDIDEGIREYRRFIRENNGTYEVVTGEEAMLKRLSEGCKLERELNGNKYLLRLS